MEQLINLFENVDGKSMVFGAAACAAGTLVVGVGGYLYMTKYYEFSRNEIRQNDFVSSAYIIHPINSNKLARDYLNSVDICSASRTVMCGDCFSSNITTSNSSTNVSNEDLLKSLQ